LLLLRQGRRIEPRRPAPRKSLAAAQRAKRRRSPTKSARRAQRRG
jgi:hypothetical protein